MSFYTTKHIIDYLADNTKTTNLRALMQMIENMAEDVHTQLGYLETRLDVENAVETNLDNLGNKILSLLRTDGLSDADYRNRVRFRIREIHAHCEFDEVTEGIVGLAQGTNARTVDIGNAKVAVYADGTGYPGIKKDLKKLIAAGVGLELTISNGEPLAFLRDDGSPPSWGLFWSENGDATPDGGVISEQYTN